MSLFSPEFEKALSILIAEKLAEALASFKLIPGKADLDTYITRQDAAKYLNICLSTLHNYTKQGKIKTYRIGNRVLIKKSELDASIN